VRLGSLKHGESVVYLMIGKPTLLAQGLDFPESPRWRGDRLWFPDMGNKVVMSLVPGQEPEVVVEIDNMPSGLGWLPDGSLLISSVQSKRILRMAAGELTVHADQGNLPGDSLNDMFVDASGNAYVGTRTHNMDRDSPGEARDTLVRVSPDGQVKVAAHGLIAPNGCVLAGDRVVLAETYAHRITEFTQQPDGSLSDRRLFASTGTMYPDGIWPDDDDAEWGGDAAQRSPRFRAGQPGWASHRPREHPRTRGIGLGESTFATVWSEERQATTALAARRAPPTKTSQLNSIAREHGPDSRRLCRAPAALRSIFLGGRRPYQH
jgi:sugar lactone lactonase YvrE